MKAIFDVGANNGYDGLKLAVDNPGMHVFAFEPTPELIAAIHANKETVERMRGGAISNYTLIEKAVSDFNGRTTFHIAGQQDWGCSSLLNFSEGLDRTWPGRTDFKVTRAIDVDVIRLEDFCAEKNITAIAYLHSDTQGADLRVLEGLGRYRACLKRGKIEAPGSRSVALYKEQHVLEDVVVAFLKWGFEIERITPNDEHCNELNIAFHNKWPRAA